jgi:hypothetical protein
VDGDPLVVKQTLGQVVRHRVAQVVTADQDVDLAGVPCQEQGGLAAELAPPTTTAFWPETTLASRSLAA